MILNILIEAPASSITPPNKIVMVLLSSLHFLVVDLVATQCPTVA
jgi:hypothetical protein